ncbi:MAG: hypothetical protein V3U78_07315 [Thiotrichaceae bacterium]
MDVHIPHDHESHGSHEVELEAISLNDNGYLTAAAQNGASSVIATDQAHCVDGGGHCSHHQAHTAGLVSVNTLSGIKVPSVLFSSLKISALIHNQAPPRRPPKD